MADTDPFYILMTVGGTSIRVRAASGWDEFNESWASPSVSFPVSLSVRMWYTDDDEHYIEQINSGASAIVNSLIGEKLTKPLTIYGSVLFTGESYPLTSVTGPRGLSLDDEALVVTYAKLVSEMESAYNA